MAKLKSDFHAKLSTRGQGEAARLIVDADGTYAAQPIDAHLTGGSLLSLRDADSPWPVDLSIANGPTDVSLKGTLRDPVALTGADVTLRLDGPDLGLLQPLVGFPIPKTPSYEIAGKLRFEGRGDIRFDDLRGRLGNSDIEGTINEAPDATRIAGKSRPVVTMDLRSDRVDLADLNGFIGGQPGRTSTANETAAKREKVAQANASHSFFRTPRSTSPGSTGRTSTCAITAHISRGVISRWMT